MTEIELFLNVQYEINHYIAVFRRRLILFQLKKSIFSGPLAKGWKRVEEFGKNQFEKGQTNERAYGVIIKNNVRRLLHSKVLN